MNKAFKYTLKTSTRAKNIRIAINPKGEVTVTKPRLIPMFAVKRFIKQHQNWIDRNLTKIKARQTKLKPNTLYYKGKLYQFKYLPGTFKITLHHPNLTVSAYSRPSAIRQLIKKLQQQSRQTITEQTKKYAAKMKLTYKKIRFKDQKTRWGSCSSQKNLNFNWRLIMTPPSVLTYVVIHELAHLRHMNHSRKFWDFVEKYDPDYRENRRWLKRHQEELQINLK
jgi:predicted metal-dependent hydrolase